MGHDCCAGLLLSPSGQREQRVMLPPPTIKGRSAYKLHAARTAMAWHGVVPGRIGTASAGTDRRRSFRCIFFKSAISVHARWLSSGSD
jgi:hypothetical protein